jgi:hypothetical protein
MILATRGARFSLLVAVAILLAAAFSSGMRILQTAKAAPPIAMGFGPNVATPSGNGTNEPQITVDQSGRSYLTWQGDAAPFPGTRTTSTTDGTALTTFNTRTPPVATHCLVVTSSWPPQIGPA